MPNTHHKSNTGITIKNILKTIENELNEQWVFLVSESNGLEFQTKNMEFGAKDIVQQVGFFFFFFLNHQFGFLPC